MINIRMQHKDVKKLTPKITVIGVGGAGGNAVNNMIGAGLQGAEFIVCNTDAQALENSLCETKLQLGVEVTAGLGAGAKPEIGRAAAEESIDEVLQYLEGSNMAFITAGMGGGTGTGAAPIIARACREKGILTVGVVTKPFHFEGSLRMRMAEAGIDEMQDYVDTLIVIPNQNLFRIANEKTTFAEAFRLADGVLQSAVRGVTDLIVNPGEVNLDFSDIRTAMQEMGKAMMGMGEATGERRATQAAEMAINNPLLDDVSMKGARGVLINVTGGYDMTLFEVDEACNKIREEVDPNANIIFGSTFSEAMEGRMRVSIVATGIDIVEQKSFKRPAGAGNVTVNAVSAQAHVESALPRAAAYAHGSAAQAQPAVQRTAAPSPFLEATARRLDLEAADQQEFAIDPVKKSEPAAPVSHAGMDAPAQGSLPVTPQTAAPLRGSVYGEHFIPPKAIEVEAPRGADAYGPMGALAAKRPVEETYSATSASPGLNLRPPVPGASAQNRKRTPSLFERFTSPLRHGTEEAIENAPVERERERAPVVQQRVTQSSLDIELRRADPVDDELDIPAFLRRQAN